MIYSDTLIIMLFDKYQYNEKNIKKRGYSHHCIAEDSNGCLFWVKWILGIEKNDTNLSMLRDRLRSLQGATHICLPNIVEYDWDTEKDAYAVVYKNLENIESLENKTKTISIQDIMNGLLNLAECLNSLLSKNKITHGDIHPGNIFIDENNQFFLVDFQLSETTHALSQEKSLEIFARDFAAPEKFERIPCGFPYQADIFSFGRVIDWIFRECKQEIPEEQNLKLQQMLSSDPGSRPKWLEVIEFLKKFPVDSEVKNIHIDTKKVSLNLDELNTATPIFDIAPKKPHKNYFTYFVDIIYNKTVLRCSWIDEESKLIANSIDDNDKYIDNKKKHGEKLPFKVNFIRYSGYNLTPYFDRWFNKNKRKHSIKEQGNYIRKELKFYRDLLEKELEVISKNSLLLQYSKWEKDEEGDIVFYIHEYKNNSNRSFILKHIDEGNAINSDGKEYNISANADRKQNKNHVKFVGKPYEYEMYKDKENREIYLFKVKDCDFKEHDMPAKGYIFENTAQKDQEKRRQLDAVTKAERNEVQNPSLIYSLFTPDQLPPADFPSYEPLDCVYQKDKNGNEFEYSPNQNKAIRNALSKSPLSIIQGPPGTGKTTVITEIVFQILAKDPHAKILITSQTNNAVDQVLENLIKNKIAILRLNAITALNIKEEVREHTLTKKLAYWKLRIKETASNNFNSMNYDINISDELKKDFESKLNTKDGLKTIKENVEKKAVNNDRMKKFCVLPDAESELFPALDEAFGIRYFNTDYFKLYRLHRDWISTVSSLDEDSKINEKLIDSIRVIGATCNHIASKKYEKWNFKFDYVIMDEAGKATIAESLVPINMGNNLVFVGDHRQLRPMLTPTRDVEEWLRCKYRDESNGLESWEDYFNRPSLFEHVISNIDHNYKSQLTECRRLPPEQVVLTSKYFYESEGDEAIRSVPREIEAEHNLPLAIKAPLFFIDIGSTYRNERDNEKSSLNKESSKVIINILKCLNRYEEIKSYSIGVIACYKAQYRLLKKETDKLRGQGELNQLFRWKKPESKFLVSVVDRFQGLECDVVLLDLVKSGVGLDLGFMEVPNRINVALSRNKRLLIIVGDYRGIINAKTRTKDGEKAALQSYLENINPTWIVPADKAQGLFK